MLYSQLQKSGPNFSRAFRLWADRPSAGTTDADVAETLFKRERKNPIMKNGADGHFMQIQIEEESAGMLSSRPSGCCRLGFN
jgi:hypothetical protein